MHLFPEWLQRIHKSWCFGNISFWGFPSSFQFFCTSNGHFAHSFISGASKPPQRCLSALKMRGACAGWGHRCLLFRPAKPNGIPGGHADDRECHGCGRAPHVHCQGHAHRWWGRLTGYLRASLTLHFSLISFTLCSKTWASKPSPPRFRGRSGRCCFYSLCSNLRALSSHRFIHK